MWQVQRATDSNWNWMKWLKWRKSPRGKLQAKTKTKENRDISDCGKFYLENWEDLSMGSTETNNNKKEVTINGEKKYKKGNGIRVCYFAWE